MRQLFAISLISLAAASVVGAAPAPQESWGKAGITLERYRQDALECGLEGHYTDISKTDDAKAFVTASRQLDAVTTGGATVPMTTQINATGPNSTNAADQMVEYANQQNHIVDSVHADQRFRNIKQTLESKTAECLARRGYSRFALTPDQRRRLTKLKAGSDERRAYLYSLASNPAVLQSQRIEGQP